MKNLFQSYENIDLIYTDDQMKTLIQEYKQFGGQSSKS